MLQQRIRIKLLLRLLYVYVCICVHQVDREILDKNFQCPDEMHVDLFMNMIVLFND